MPTLFQTVFHNNQDVDSSASERLSPTTKPVYGTVIVKAHPSNTGIVYVGSADTVSTTTGVPLSAGQAIPWECKDLTDIWVIASADNQIVTAHGGV